MSPASPTLEPRAPEPPDLSRLAGLKLGNYRLDRLVGRGRMGAVYLAQDEALLRPTAIKLLAWSLAEAQGQDPVQWFLAEARLVARIDHPRVVQIYGAARHKDFCYIAMEYVPGTSAEEAVARHGPMAPDAATSVLVQAASALQAAHRSGVIHRDVKPANLLLGEKGVAKLGDFGMALGNAELRTGTAHLRVGTPFYTAPEIWRGEPASPASDLYSLGATYFHLLTGRPPFPGPDVPAIEAAHLRAPVPDPRTLRPGLPASCAALVLRTLAKSPADRHPSAQELVWEARQVLQDLASASSHSAPAPRAGAPRTAPAEAPTPRQAPPASLTALGFTRRPFTELDPAAPPYVGEPFASAREQLLAFAANPEASALALTGAPGSGRSALVRGVVAALAPARLAFALRGGSGAARPTLLARVCTLAQALDHASDDASDDARLDALVERFGEERAALRPAPLVAIDGVEASGPDRHAVERLVAAARWSRTFKVLVVGGPGLGAALAGSGAEALPEVALRPLEAPESAVYLEAWIGASRGPRAPALVVSPDAVLVAAHRAAGRLTALNRIAENMLALAAAGRSRIVTSWHAWVAPDSESWLARAPAAWPARPSPWPPPDVARVIDACRRAAGRRPGPRTEGTT